MKFKKGDMVILISATKENAYSIGNDYVIEDCGVHEGKAYYIIFNPNDLSDADHGEWLASEIDLKLVKPPEILSTWEQVQEQTGWNPVKQKVYVEV